MLSTIEQNPSLDKEYSNQPPSEMDALLEEMQQSLGNEDSNKKEEQDRRREQQEAMQQKREEGLEAIAPGLKENEELVKNRRFLQGGRWYYALQNNQEGYSALLDETKKILEQDEVVLKQAREKYEQVTGEEPDWGMHFDWIESEEPDRLLNGDTLTELERERYLLTKDSIRPAHMSRWNRVGDRAYEEAAYPRTPNELLEVKINNYDFYSPSAKPRDTHTLVRGIGYAALQSKDIKIAAKALAFSESIEPASEELVKHAQKLLNQLSPEEKQTYIDAYHKATFDSRNTQKK